MRVGIHQPEHLPWYGFFDKISKVDKFVILDTVQFEKNSFQNRNNVRSGDWFTVAIQGHSLDTQIKDIKISEVDWQTKYFRVLNNNYRGSWWLSDIELITQRYTDSLSELNIELIKFLLKRFKINTPLVLASELNIPRVRGGTNVVKQICERLGATEYLSGIGGRNYLDESVMGKIKVEYNNPQFPHCSALERL